MSFSVRKSVYQLFEILELVEYRTVTMGTVPRRWKHRLEKQKRRCRWKY
jgi:argininosuccinate lyase